MYKVIYIEKNVLNVKINIWNLPTPPITMFKLSCNLVCLAWMIIITAKPYLYTETKTSPCPC
jgi:hypothetical protein